MKAEDTEEATPAAEEAGDDTEAGAEEGDGDDEVQAEDTESEEKIEEAAAITPTAKKIAMKRPAAAPAIPKGTTAMHDLSQYLSAGPNLDDGFGDT